MGIKELWSILGPFCERKPLYELQGKTVAIDLSGWVCDSQNVVEYNVQPKMYLRNLYFRTCYLLLSGVTPVFVLEGTAPPLKFGTICKRNEIQFKGSKPRDKNTISKPDKGRTRFNSVLKLCEELLNVMGLSCIQGVGEAEALCAHLNEDGLVDGIISQDSDCFGYGALRVFRNFSVSQQGHVAAQGGAVDVYDLNRVRQNMELGRNHMIAMAWLCGCDYSPEGVGGVGKDAAMKLIQEHPDDKILDRIRSWRTKDAKFTAMEIKVDDKSICTMCGHHGRAQSHTKSGCSICKTTRGCDETLYREQRLSLKNELLIRKKALKEEGFPNEEIAAEFLTRPSVLPKLDLSWRQPNLIKFTRIMSAQLSWSEIYCMQKFLPLLTRWQMMNSEKLNDISAVKGILLPNYIRKKRIPKGVASYEIIWKDKDNCYDGLVPEEQIQSFLDQNTKGIEALWSTIEPQDFVEKAYPELVETFLAPKKITKPKRQKRVISEGTSKTKAAKVKTAASKNKNSEYSSLEDLLESQKTKKTINQFFKTVKNYNAFEAKHDYGVLKESRDKVEVQLKNTSDANLKVQDKTSLNLSGFPSDIESDCDEDVIGSVIDTITSRPGIKNDKMYKNVLINMLNKKVEERSIIILDSDEETNDLNKTFFFEAKMTENDEFEKTFNDIIGLSDSDSEDTIEYDYEVDCKHKPHSSIDKKLLDPVSVDKTDDLDDTFELPYIPLFERLNKRK